MKSNMLKKDDFFSINYVQVQIFHVFTEKKILIIKYFGADL